LKRSRSSCAESDFEKFVNEARLAAEFGRKNVRSGVRVTFLTKSMRPVSFIARN
jgi:hypothetical protein